MTTFIRNAKNKTLIEFEVVKRDGELEPSAALYVANYSQFLLTQAPEDQGKVIAIFEQLDEVRGWYYERYLMQGPRPGNREDIKQIIHTYISDSGVLQLGLHTVED